MTYVADPDPESALTPLQAAACTYRIAFGPRAGQKVLTLQSVPNRVTPPTPQRCVNEQGFSLYAEVRLAINERHKLERLQPDCAITRLRTVAFEREDHACRTSVARGDRRRSAYLREPRRLCRA